MRTSAAKQHSIGWIGLGRMGSGMAERLLEGGCALSLWNRTREKAESLAGAGARVVEKPVDLAAHEIVFTMVSTAADLKEVLFGKDGLLGGDGGKPRLIVDCSSIDEAGSAEIRAATEARGVAFLCAPVSGNSKAVKAGMLTVVASGPRDGYELAEPYLALLGRGSTYVGEGELARIVKIAHNTMLGVVIQCLCEITLLAQKAGVPRHVFLEFLNNSAMGSHFTRSKTQALVNLDFTTTFTPKLLLKDMDLGLDAGRAYGVPMPVAATMRQQLQGVVNQCYDDIDFSVMLTEQARAAHVELEPEHVTVSAGLSKAAHARARSRV